MRGKILSTIIFCSALGVSYGADEASPLRALTDSLYSCWYSTAEDSADSAKITNIRDSINKVVEKQAEETDKYFKPITSSDSPVKRVNLPDWLNNPQDEYQRCVKALSEKYKGLCIEDCYVVAKQLLEYRSKKCECLPDTIPLRIPKDRKECIDWDEVYK